MLSSLARSSACCTPLAILRPMVLSLCGAFSVITATPSSRTSYSTSLSKTAEENAGIRLMVPFFAVARAALAI